jgi:phosphate transport system permease protein
MPLTTIGSASSPAIEGSVARSISGSGRDVKGTIFEVSLVACLLVSLVILAVLIASIITDGIGVYADRGWDFLDSGLSSTAEMAGISQAIVGSFWIALCVIVFAIPIGVGSAIYLEEYAPQNRLTSFIEVNIRNLAGVPSVVYGLLGLAIFVEALNGFTTNEGVARRTLAAAGVTLAVLVLPIVVITSAEAIRAVPQALREGAYGVGATRWEVIRSQVLPYAAPGILTGSLLSIARAVGEAAPLIVVGAVTGFFSEGVGLNVRNLTDPAHLSQRFVALPTTVTEWAKEPSPAFKVENASAAIVAMLVFVLLINSIAIVLRNRFERRRSE